MTVYQLGQEVEGVVESILPFGVFLRLADRTKAYIRRRELALDPDVEPARTVQKGDQVKAMVISLEKPNKCLELSRRNLLEDGWAEFSRRYREGSIIEGVVQSLHPHGIFLRLAPGIRGFVPLDEMTDAPIFRPEELLWVEDRVEAVMTRIDRFRKRIWLSIKARQRQREQALEAFDLVGGSEAEESDLAAISTQRRITEIIPREILSLVGPILIVDDHEEVRDSLAIWLRQCGCDAKQAASLSEALSMIERGDWWLILVDLNLLDCDGLDLVHRARKLGSQAHFCVMSSPGSLDRRATELEDIKILQAFPKPLDLRDLEQFILRLANGEAIKPWRAEHTRETSAASIIPDSTLIEARDETPIRRLQTTLSWMAESLRAQACVVFWLDPITRAISALVQYGLGAANQAATYGLCESPVKDVIREGSYVYENRVGEDAHARFARLLNYLSFESCLGIPIKIHGEIQHAVFFFHRERDAFSPESLQNAYVCSTLIAALLMEDALNKRLQALHPMLLSGELSAGFGHEVANKVSGLEIHARNMLHKCGDSDLLASEVTCVLDLVLDMKETVEAFQQLSRINQINNDESGCDLNVGLQRAERLLRPIAIKEGVRIHRQSVTRLPRIAGNAVALQQVFINLMLNAIQQMAVKGGEHRMLSISVSTGQGERPIQVRFWDNGPGIHRQLWEKIFLPGFSTRGGSGLGLFIARNFINSLGGRLQVEESFIPLGTTFLVELPKVNDGAGK